MSDPRPPPVPPVRPLLAILAAAFLGAVAGGVAAFMVLALMVPDGGGTPPRVAAQVDGPAAGDECRLGGERLAEVETLLADAAAPTLTAWEQGRLLSAAVGTLSALEARLHRHGACLAGEIAAVRARVAEARGTARQAILAPVLDALAAHEAVAAETPAAVALADLAAARVALARARSDSGDGDVDADLRALQRRLEDAYGGWAREQQRRYDLWALDRARALDAWARANLSDIPLRGAGKAEIAAQMVEWLGPVEVRQLEPAVQTVHGELFQRLWRELGEEARIRVVADMVAAPKRLPAEM